MVDLNDDEARNSGVHGQPSWTGRPTILSGEGNRRNGYRGAGARHRARRDNDDDPEAARGHLFPDDWIRFPFPRRPRDGRGREGGLHVRGLSTRKIEKAADALARGLAALARLAHDVGPRRGGRRPQRARREGAAFPYLWLDATLPQVPRRGARAVQGRVTAIARKTTVSAGSSVSTSST